MFILQSSVENNFSLGDIDVDNKLLNAVQD
jgi:hypothetical protein